jgi:acyl-CoA synthetase (AMP-forming)/AMP-acid ligase II
VVIADAEGGVAARGRVGEICVQGPNVAAGYLDRPDESRAVFRAELEGAEGTFLRTGDLGFLLDGELYVTGRLKDIVVIAGRNHYPQDIERSVREAHPRIRLAVALAGGGEDSEELVVVAEYRGDAEEFAADGDEVREAVVAAVVREHGVTPAEVAFTRPGGVPTTTSGKIRRLATRDAYLEGALKALKQPEGVA